MPTKDTEKINVVAYIDGKPIEGIEEIILPEISAARGNFINKLKKLIRTKILVFIAKCRMRRGR